MCGGSGSLAHGNPLRKLRLRTSAELSRRPSPGSGFSQEMRSNRRTLRAVAPFSPYRCFSVSCPSPLTVLRLRLWQAFVVKHYQPRKFDYPEFEDSFRALLRDAEAAADVSKHAPAQRKQAVGNGLAVRGCCLPRHCARALMGSALGSSSPADRLCVHVSCMYLTWSATLQSGVCRAGSHLRCSESALCCCEPERAAGGGTCA